MLNTKYMLVLGMAGLLALGAASPSMAAPVVGSAAAVKAAAGDDAIAVQWRGWGWRGGWGWRRGLGIGLGLGLAGAALAAPYYGGYGYGGPYYGYGYGPAVAVVPLLWICATLLLWLGLWPRTQPDQHERLLTRLGRIADPLTERREAHRAEYPVLRSLATLITDH